jgi:opacity protein-like surface antigen
LRTFAALCILVCFAGLSTTSLHSCQWLLPVKQAFKKTVLFGSSLIVIFTTLIAQLTGASPPLDLARVFSANLEYIFHAPLNCGTFNMRKILTITIVALAAIASPALAEEGFYSGIGLGYSAMDSLAIERLDNTSSSFEDAVLGVTLGYRTDAGSMFYAAEVDSDLGFGQEFSGDGNNRTCSAGADNAYHCTHDLTLRLRGVAGTQMGAYEVFGSLGAVMVRGTSAVGEIVAVDVKSFGYTVSLGIQRPLGSGTGRLELIYDNADNDDGPSFGAEPPHHPDYSAITLKSTYLF